jgi:two-component system, OmpR family, response regulator
MRILVIEDDVEIAEFVAQGLTAAGHNISIAGKGDAGLKLAMTEPFDAMIVDRMLPSMDGLTLVRELRKVGILTPVLCLTSLSGVEDRVDGLEAGADDYLVKPFDFSELLARVNALIRRSGIKTEPLTLKVADLEINLISRVVTRGGQAIDLQPREFKLLEILMQNGRVVTKAMLLRHVWDFHFDPKTSVVETHISRLRGKIDRSFDTPLLHTIRGMGYRLSEAN